MKKLILAIFAALLLAGCNVPTKVHEDVIVCDDDMKIRARKFEYEGHQYIEFYRHMPTYDNNTGFVHDPNCECMIDYD